MAITNLISGELRNKIGGMVGAKWKGKNYVRAYVIPKDAKTPGQVEVRTSFKMLNQLASRINETVLKPYQAKPVANKSPVNVFVALNKPFMSVKSTDPLDIKIFNGALPLGTAAVAPVAAADAKVTITITPATYGIAKPEDTLIAIAYNQTLDTYNTATAPRGSGAAVALDVEIPTVAGDVLYLWVTASQPKFANGPTLAFTATVTA
ncbi:MAG: hypothetical protein LBB78_10495 [Spirochaetaceae bacterium]|jgi:hypothetical protein|nr:hypothetical protein [Spirochaetaceae bacterium]